jgi:3-oxoacyl-[acyl-carrier protein] reductase
VSRLSKISRSVDGRVAIVTGAASGMGRATAFLLADEGARVACVDRNAEGVLETVDRIDEAHGEGRALALTADLADAEAIKALVAATREQLGPVDILVNNAGLVAPAVFEAGDDEAYEAAWATTLAVDLTAHQRLVRACLDDLKRDGEGRVVNIASTEGVGASRYNSPYVAAKHGVIGLTRAMAVELAATGVTFNAVCPGPIRTGMTAGIPDEAKDKFARRMVPARRYGDPEEVAHAIVNLCLPSASYQNGSVTIVDGGMTAKND